MKNTLKRLRTLKIRSLMESFRRVRAIKGFLKASEKNIVEGDFRTDNIPHRKFSIQVF